VGADAPAGDCDDGDAAINPEGVETAADGVDSNCDGIEECYVDADGDGYRTDDGAVVDSEFIDCAGDGVSGADAPATDCDDERADVNPGQVELVGDEVDGDCNGVEDCYVDADGDGYRTTEVVQSIDSDCSDDGEATVDEPLVDCDDSLASVNPGAEEVEGDGLDQDCDGVDGGDGVAADDTATPSGSADGDASDAPIEVTVEMDAPAAEKGGCSTAGSASGGTVGWAVALLGLAGLRRRRAA
jgi:uncharacterized protein (TIGR03382 family)